MKNKVRNVLLKKLGSSDVFSLGYESSMTIKIGRAIDNDIRIEQNADSVSRYHANIVVKNMNFEIRDLGSTNGLYVNDMKVEVQDLMPGDRIRLGKNGPEFEFDLDPRPESLSAKTRVIGVPTETREISTIDSSDDIISDIDSALESDSKQRIGKETVERMIKSEKKKPNVLNWVIGLVSIAALALAAFIFFNKPDERIVIHEPDGNSGMTPKEIAEKYGKAVVMIKNAWKLVYTPTGEDIYHLYEMDPKTKRVYAVYFRNVNNNSIEPLCVRGRPNNFSKLMSGSGQGSGFVISPEGFIVTNRHVANTWMDLYGFPPGAFPGRLIELTGAGTLAYNDNYVVTQDDLKGFIPANMQSLDRAPIDDKSIAGTLFFTDVLFPGTSNPISATVNRVSDKHDVVILKINYSGRLKSTDLNLDDIKQGEEITVMGYPVLSPQEVVEIDSKTMFSANRHYETIAQPSIFNGIISKKVGQNADLEKVFSMGGDTYQLNVSESGAGNSGGPVFDKKGRVIGIYTYRFSAPGMGALSFAVPIKYANELLNVY